MPRVKRPESEIEGAEILQASEEIDDNLDRILGNCEGQIEEKVS